MNRLSMCAAVAAALALPALAAHAAPPKAKITPAQAKATALKKIPGKAQPAKYEFEDGHWQYAVLVQNKKGLYEVEVDATTGKVTDTEKTTAAEEAQEAAADAKAAQSGKGEAGEKGEANGKGEAGEKD